MVVAFTTVDEFLEAQTDDVRAQVQLLRETILGCSDQLEEHIKWNSPSYVYKNDDRITLHARGPALVRVVLHMGATTSEDKAAAPIFAGDPHDLLAWHSNIRASMAFGGVDEIRTKERWIIDVLRAWLAQVS
jgi:hypothetical protein